MFLTIFSLVNSYGSITFVILLHFDATVTSDPILIVDKLSLLYSTRILFKDVSFELYQGEVLAIMGPSGTGKSLLTKVIAGFLPSGILTKGSIWQKGIEISQQPMLQRNQAQRSAVIFQDALKALNPLASIEQQLSLALTKSRTRLDSRNKELVLSLLVQLGFTDAQSMLSSFPSQLSGGQRQRICIAIALLGNTSLIIADEPTSALDPITESNILRLFFRIIKDRNISGILITHDLFAALECDKLLVISNDASVAYGTPYDAILQNKHPFCQQLAQLLP